MIVTDANDKVSFALTLSLAFVLQAFVSKSEMLLL